ncbi:MAG: cysteine desulfurase [Clostridia bacterium]|nr:cysteine desulfurase [Clostridia bacterium]
MIYLDHAATTPADPRVIAAMNRCMEQAWLNPSAAYAGAGVARRTLRLARQAVAGMLNAEPQEIVFTSGGTEANNQAMALARGGHAVVSAIEHASVLRAAEALCREVTLVAPEPDGRVRPEAVERALRPDTKLISVQLANNETGALQPVHEIGALARARRVPLHCDAVQAFGHVPVDVKALKADMLSLSGHKLYGPRGVGALYVRQGVLPPPLLLGGGQELGRRAGTENLPAIAGLMAAAELAAEDMAERAAREAALLSDFCAALTRRVSGCRLLAEASPRLPGIAALLLPGRPSEAMIARLDAAGILVSGGAACASREPGPSHVYRAMGLRETDANCVLRVSVGRENTAADMRAAADAIVKIMSQRDGSFDSLSRFNESKEPSL